MRKSFFASCLLLLLASGLVWSANAAATDVQASAEQTLELYGPAHGAVNATPAASCTLNCPNDPVSCTSTAGNCRWMDVKGFVYAVCDDQWHFCPSGWGW